MIVYVAVPLANYDDGLTKSVSEEQLPNAANRCTIGRIDEIGEDQVGALYEQLVTVDYKTAMAKPSKDLEVGLLLLVGVARVSVLKRGIYEINTLASLADVRPPVRYAFGRSAGDWACQIHLHCLTIAPLDDRRTRVRRRSPQAPDRIMISIRQRVEILPAPAERLGSMPGPGFRPRINTR